MKINTRDIKRLERTLTGMSKHGVKFAVAKTMNGAAFDARKIALRNIDREFTIRNAWTKRSVRVDKGNTRNLRAIVGSTRDYMRKQELGGTERAKGRRGVPIPTSYGSGEGLNARPRKRMPRRSNRLLNIHLKKNSGRGLSRKAKQVSRVKQAAKGNNKIIFMKTRKGQGLFRIIGGKRKPEVKMIHDLSRKKIKVKKKPWLGPATRIAQRGIPRKYQAALMQQINKAAIRNGLRPK